MNTPLVGPYRVLGYYMPPKKGHYASKIAKAILAILKPFNLQPKLRGTKNSPNAWGPQTTSIWSDWSLHAEVRRFAQPNGQGSGWHKDGDMEPNPKEVMDHAAVLWSEKVPTQFKYNGTIYQPEPGQIVIARNLGCAHRSPPNTPKPPKRRWFFRQRVEVPTHLELP